jgi:hypothetical protein
MRRNSVVAQFRPRLDEMRAGVRTGCGPALPTEPAGCSGCASSGQRGALGSLDSLGPRRGSGGRAWSRCRTGHRRHWVRSCWKQLDPERSRTRRPPTKRTDGNGQKYVTVRVLASPTMTAGRDVRCRLRAARPLLRPWQWHVGLAARYRPTLASAPELALCDPAVGIDGDRSARPRVWMPQSELPLQLCPRAV